MNTEMFYKNLANNSFNIPNLFVTLLISTLPFCIWWDVTNERFRDSISVQSNLNKLYDGNEQTFDYIIVGSGSAGFVLANRLSLNNKVLLLEAGGTPSPLSEIPFFKGFLPGTEMTYNYPTVSQENMGFAYKDKVQNIPRGKVLGGTGQINSMMYVRGNKFDYEKLALLVGDTAFSYENVLKAFKKQEDYHGRFSNPKFHGTGGELYVGNTTYYTKISKNVMEALAEKNITVGDYNGEVNGPIFNIPEQLIKNGRRFSGYEAFLEPILNRSNLSIYKYSKATKILLDSTETAYGVEYTRHGYTFKAFASKEVILCAGVYESPKLLMLSGIGDSRHLTSVGITPIINLPGVGQNLIENPYAVLYVPVDANITFVNSRDLKPHDLKAYLENGTGPFSSNRFRATVGFINSNNNKPTSYPDISIIMEANGIPSEFDSTYGKEFNKYLTGYMGKDGMRMHVDLFKIKSGPGYLQLKSSDPSESMIIDPKYLNNEADIEAMIDGINFIVDLIETTKAFREIGAHIITNKFPGCESYNFKSREYWKCYIQQTGGSSCQTVGTCKMGQKEDSYAVVDSNFCVLKTKSLRVIDSSVIPFFLTGNPHAESMMLAEIASSKILNTK